MGKSNKFLVTFLLGIIILLYYSKVNKNIYLIKNHKNIYLIKNQIGYFSYIQQ